MMERPIPLPRCNQSSSTTTSFKSIQLFKEETLGIGAYGKVCRAKCDNLPCAAKIIHETLFDPTAERQMPRGHEHRLPIRRFEQECQFLNTIRHPNVIQYLGMYTDPDTGLPVLLMELMDDSLTHFLEAATQQIPYHIQVNICHDIAMALTFLHANGIVHRDLSSNNVLLISNVRAKVTDFGMAKLCDINSRASRLTFTMCPGTDVYMPPEAIQDQPVYSEKIDCFSFGVIVIQMLTRQFPNPSDRMQRVESHPDYPRRTMMMCIPEIERRHHHISLVDPNHSLLPISLDCLKDSDVERPSAQQLSVRVAALKEQSKYAESASHAETRERDLLLQSQREQYSQQILELQVKLTKKDDTIQSLRDQHEREIQELLTASDEAIVTKNHEIQDLIRSHDEVIQAKVMEIHQLRELLQQVTSEMNQRDQTCEPSIDLGNKIQRISLSNRQECAHPPDIRLRWRMGKRAPELEGMYRWCDASVGECEVYFNAGSENRVYSYNTNSELWFQLPDCPNKHCSFAVIDNQLTAIGGLVVGFMGAIGSLIGGQRSNKLYSLKQQKRQLQWVEEFPPMPTKRSSTTSICTKTSLIVAGGDSGWSNLTCVEVMNRDTCQWSVAANMPTGMLCASGVICGDRLYVGGGRDSKSVYSCSLSDLLQSCQSVSPTAKQKSSNTFSVWNKLTDLPKAIRRGSTLVSLCGQLLAIGGWTGGIGERPSNSIYIYKTIINSWKVISQMLLPRRDCFAFTVPINKVMVVGGFNGGGSLFDIDDLGMCTNTVEFADSI